MPTVLDYAVLSAVVYTDVRQGDKNNWGQSKINC